MESRLSVSIRVHPGLKNLHGRHGRSWDELQPHCCEGRHTQQQPAVPPALNVGFAISAGLVTNRQIEDAQVEFCRAKQQVEIAERIEIAEIRAMARDGLVVFSEEHLGAAERVLDRLAKQPRE